MARTPRTYEAIDRVFEALQEVVPQTGTNAISMFKMSSSSANNWDALGFTPNKYIVVSSTPSAITMYGMRTMVTVAAIVKDFESASTPDVNTLTETLELMLSALPVNGNWGVISPINENIEKIEHRSAGSHVASIRLNVILYDK